MKLDFIDLGKLSISKANMRYAKKAPDVSDILPTVRKRGVVVPVLVRANGSPDTFEIVAGARRYHAGLIVADERRAAGEDVDPMPCAILDGGDDADAIEASLIENIARLDPDEVTRWATFTRLVKRGGISPISPTPSDFPTSWCAASSRSAICSRVSARCMRARTSTAPRSAT